MYKDRGIIKWAPFDSLGNINNLLTEIKYKNNKKNKVVLLEDKLEQLDFVINKAIRDNEVINIEYFEDGYTKLVYGRIKKVDLILKMIILENKISIKIIDIINMYE